jgi:phosphoglycerate dehydrogenase-like enzyme
LKTIARLGVGLNNIDLDAAWAAGIIVTITPGTLHDSVADHVMALTLALARKIIPSHLSSNSKVWTPYFGFELRNKVFGLIGLGKIGKAVCERARAFGMRLVALDLYPDFTWAKENNVEILPLEQVLENSDVVSLHVPLEWGKVPLIDSKHLSMMKNSALLINTARSCLIDETALLEALQKGRLGGAGLDMFSENAENVASFYRLPNVIMTPQSSGSTYEVHKRMGEMAIDNCLRALRGELPLHPVWKEER